MPIPGICQPEMIILSPTLRLRAYDGDYAKGFAWYQNPELVWFVDGSRTPYSWEILRGMYAFLNARGEEYWIEYREGEDEAFRAIGDVTLMPEDLPIVIGEPALHGRGIGKAVLRGLIQRARELGWDHLAVKEIYDFNPRSAACFAAVGFVQVGKTERGSSWRMELQ